MPKLPAIQWVRSGVSEGLSATIAFARYQIAASDARFQTGEDWRTTGQNTFFQMYSETRSARQAIETALAAPKNIPGGGLTPTERTTQRATGLGHWAVVFHRTIGSPDVERFFYLLRGNELLTPAQVEDRARADFEEHAQDIHGTVYRSVVEGVIFTGVEQYRRASG